MELPARDEPPELEEPGKEPLDLPASAIATELAAILRYGPPTTCAMWRDQPERAAGPEAPGAGV